MSRRTTPITFDMRSDIDPEAETRPIPVSLSTECETIPDAELNISIDHNADTMTELSSFMDPSNWLAPWIPGREIEGLYRIVGEIARGGMGIIYKVFDLTTDEHVIIKTLRQDVSASAEWKQRFIREAEEWVKIGIHPYIVHAHTAYEVDNLPIIVAEFIDGPTLHHLIKTNPPSFTHKLRIAIQICWGMAFAHDRGIAHRDLKPANILIHPDGHAKITDFGLVKRILDEASSMPDTVDLTAQAALTTIGTLGTPEYMSPEQWQGGGSQSSDIYSFGILLYELFCERLPFDYSTELKTKRVSAYRTAHLSKQPPTPVSMKQDLPAVLSQILEDCLQKQEADRPSSFRNLASRLNNFMKQVTDEEAIEEPEKEHLDQKMLLNKAWALCRLAKSSNVRNDYQHGYQLSTEALEIFLQEKNIEGQSRCYSHLSVIHRIQGRYDEALQSIEKSLALSTSIDLKFQIAGCHFSLGRLDYLRGNYEDALTHYNTAFDHYKELEVYGGTGRVLTDMAVIKENRGDTQEALADYTEALNMMRLAKDTLGAAGCLGKIGACYYTDKKYQDALHYFKQALTIFRHYGDRSGYSSTLLFIGTTQFQMKDHEQALKTMEKVKAIQESIGRRKGVGQATVNIAFILLEMDRPKEALQFALDAMQIKQNLDDKRGLAINYHCLGKIHEKLLDNNAALPMHRAAIELAEQLQMHQTTEYKAALQAILDSEE